MKKGMKTEWKKICLITIAGCMLLEGCKASDSAVQSITPEKVSGGESVQSAQETQQEDQQQTNDQDKGTENIRTSMVNRDWRLLGVTTVIMLYRLGL